MLTYVFNEVGVPLYEQVYKSIKNDIIKGSLKPGEKLPSKRTFANNNGISTITIQNAYDQLISEGYIYTIPKKGYYVSDIAGIANVPTESRIRLDIRLPKQPVRYDMDLSNNKIAPDSFPFSIWAKLTREVLAGKSAELMETPLAAGIIELRQAIADHLKSFRGMLVDPNQIVVGAGTEYLYGLIVQLLGNDREYCIENPGYRKLSQIYSQYHINCRYADMDDSGITAKVKSALVDAKDIKSNDISVNTSKGVVTLNGFVSSQDQAERAVTLAKGVEGVKSVSDKLHVKDSTKSSVKGYASDTAITSEVKAKLLADDLVPSRNVKVETQDGLVQLSGTVKTKAQSDRAESVASAIEGVKSVKNDLTVKQ